MPAEPCQRFSEPDHRTECEGAWGLGPTRALLNPVTFLLDLLAVGRLVRSALLPRGRLMQGVVVGAWKRYRTLLNLHGFVTNG
jgi:hypothetical protein